MQMMVDPLGESRILVSRPSNLMHHSQIPFRAAWADGAVMLVSEVEEFLAASAGAEIALGNGDWREKIF